MSVAPKETLHTFARARALTKSTRPTLPSRLIISAMTLWRAFSSPSTAGKVGVSLLLCSHAFGFTASLHTPTPGGSSSITLTPSAATTSTNASGYNLLSAPWLRCGSVAAPDASPTLPSLLSSAPWARSFQSTSNVAGPRSRAQMLGMVMGDPWIRVGGETMQSSIQSRVDYGMLHRTPWARSALEATTTEALGSFLSNSPGTRSQSARGISRQPSGCIGGRLGSGGAGATPEEINRITSNSGSMLSSAPWARSSTNVDGAAAISLNGRGHVEYATSTDNNIYTSNVQDWQLLTQAPWFLSMNSNNKEEQKNMTQRGWSSRHAGASGQPDAPGVPFPTRAAASCGVLEGSPWNADTVVALATEKKTELSGMPRMLSDAPWLQDDRSSGGRSKGDAICKPALSSRDGSVGSMLESAPWARCDGDADAGSGALKSVQSEMLASGALWNEDNNGLSGEQPVALDQVRPTPDKMCCERAPSIVRYTSLSVALFVGARRIRNDRYRFDPMRGYYTVVYICCTKKLDTLGVVISLIDFRVFSTLPCAHDIAQTAAIPHHHRP